MKALAIVLVVFVAAVCSLPIEQENVDNQQPEVLVTLVDDGQLYPNVGATDDLTRDKRNGGNIEKFLVIKVFYEFYFYSPALGYGGGGGFGFGFGFGGKRIELGFKV